MQCGAIAGSESHSPVPFYAAGPAAAATARPSRAFAATGEAAQIWRAAAVAVR